MNRIIKFRVWDDKYRFFLNNYSASLVMGVALAYGHNGCDTEELGTWIDFSDIDNKEKYSHYHIQQFTGLKDKNGKEIYEGDLIEYSGCQLEKPFVVKFISGIFVLAENNNIEKFQDGFTQDVIERQESLKIIGNIYENPELIK